MLGTLILWFGWYGFNAGSTTALSGGAYETAGQCCVTTTLSAAAGGLVNFGLASKRCGKWDVTAFANGILGGLVGITAGCDAVDAFVAIIIGVFSGIWVELSVRLLTKFKIDDPLSAYPVHGACGIWGVIATGLFHLEKGWFYGHHFDECLGPNIVGLICIIVWCVGLTAPLFWGMKRFGLFRVDADTELIGLDSHYQFGDQLNAQLKGLKSNPTSDPVSKETSPDHGSTDAVVDAKDIKVQMNKMSNSPPSAATKKHIEPPTDEQEFAAGQAV